MSNHRHGLIRLVLVSSVLVLPATEAQTDSTYSQAYTTRTIDIGYIPARAPGASGKDRLLSRIVDELKELSQRRKEVDGKPESEKLVDMVLGSNYQVRAWFESGQIDAAIVTGFLAAQLVARSQDADMFVRRIELDRLGTSFVVNVEPHEAPLARYECLLENICRQSKGCKRTSNGSCDGSPTLHLVNHLSGSGFYVPLQLAHTWCDGQCGDAFWSELKKSWKLQVFHDPSQLVNDQAVVFSSAMRQVGWCPLPEQGTIGQRTYDLPKDGLFFLTRGNLYVETEAVEESHELDEWIEAATAFKDVLKNFPTSTNWYEPKPENDRFVTELPYAYDFSLADVVEIIRTDQDPTDDFAIVLPGGGVKCAFQAGVLDQLYRTHITNVPEGTESGSALQVRHVVGTSGGALVGFFASQLTDQKLESIWKLQGNWLVMRDVFTIWFSVPFFGSCLLVMFIFLIGNFFLYDLRPWHSDDPPNGKLVVLLGAIVVAFVPWTTGLLKRGELFDEPVLALSVVFTVLLLAFHGIVAFVRWTPVSEDEGSKGSPRLVALLSGMGLLGAIVLVMTRGLIAAEWHLYLPTVWTAVLLGAIAFLYRPDDPAERLFRYAKIVLTLIAFMAAVFSSLVILSWTGWTSTFAMAGLRHYWVPLVALSVAWTLGFFYASKRGFSFLDEILSAGRRPGLALALVLVLGFASWNLFVIPSIYNAAKPSEILKRQATDWLKKEGKLPDADPITNASDIELLTTLTVTVVDLKAPRHGNYLCFQGKYGGDCPPPVSTARFLENKNTSGGETLKYGQLSQAVLASGSPFPLFPHQKIDLVDSPARYVDGGFAHNLPIEGASLVGAEQAMVIALQGIGAKEPTFDMRTMGFGALSSGLPRILSVLFHGSQDLDLHRAADMLVVEVSSPMQKPPFLGDFSMGQAEYMYKRGEQSATRRHRVISWGPPRRRFALGRQDFSLYTQTHFASSRCELAGDSRELTRLAEILKGDRWKNLGAISVTGYADKLQPEDKKKDNDCLSYLRAKSVRQFLLELPQHVVACVGGVPENPGDTPVERQLDRRVEITAGYNDRCSAPVGCVYASPCEWTPSANGANL